MLPAGGREVAGAGASSNRRAAPVAVGMSAVLAQRGIKAFGHGAQHAPDMGLHLVLWHGFQFGPANAVAGMFHLPAPAGHAGAGNAKAGAFIRCHLAIVGQKDGHVGTCAAAFLRTTATQWRAAPINPLVEDAETPSIRTQTA